MSSVIEAPLGYFARVEMGQSPASDDVAGWDGDGLAFLQGNAEFGPLHPRPEKRCDIAPKRAPSGSILVSVRAPVGAINVADRRYGIGRGLCAVVPDAQRFDPGFAWWAIQASRHQLDAVATGSTYAAVSAQDVANLRVPMPSLEVQRRVADMLDAETARIDTLITKNQRLLDLAGRRLNSLADATFHPGANAEGWRRIKMRWLVREVDDRAGDRAGELPHLSVSEYRGVVPRRTDSFGQVASEDSSHYKVCLEGELVLNKLWAFRGAIGRAPMPGLVSPDYAVLRPQPEVSCEYLHHLTRSPWFVGRMAAKSRGIGGIGTNASRSPRISIHDFGQIEVSIPPSADQPHVAAAFHAEEVKVQNLRSHVEKMHRLLRARRQALITAAVTGQITV